MANTNKCVNVTSSGDSDSPQRAAVGGEQAGSRRSSSINRRDTGVASQAPVIFKTTSAETVVSLVDGIEKSLTVPASILPVPDKINLKRKARDEIYNWTIKQLRPSMEKYKSPFNDSSEELQCRDMLPRNKGVIRKRDCNYQIDDERRKRCKFDKSDIPMEPFVPGKDEKIAHVKGTDSTDVSNFESFPKEFVAASGNYGTSGGASTSISFQCEVPDEVVLMIFSYLNEKDLCKTAQVCKRFQAIANDKCLWKKLYKSVFEYDTPLIQTENRGFKFIPSEKSEYQNPWKKSFSQLKKGCIHIRPRYNGTAKDPVRKMPHLETIKASLDYAEGHLNSEAKIFIHPGNYPGEFLMMGSNVPLIGTTPGVVTDDAVILTADFKSTVMFITNCRTIHKMYGFGILICLIMINNIYIFKMLKCQFYNMIRILSNSLFNIRFKDVQKLNIFIEHFDSSQH